LHDVTARPLVEAKRVSLLDTAYATTHLGFVSTTEGQIDADQRVAERFNSEAKKAGWDVRVEQFGPALPDILYRWDGQFFRPALPGARHVDERWRRLGLAPPPLITLRLHHESAKRKGVLVPARQGPIISKPSAKGWALEYRPAGGLEIVGDLSTIKRVKRGEWLSDRFVTLLTQGDALRGATLWAIGSPQAPYADQPAYQRTFHREASWEWDRRLRKRVFWQEFDNESAIEARLAERAEIKLREYALSASQPLYRKPHRPGFWNLRDYSESARLLFKSGRYGSVDRQHGLPGLHVLIVPARAIFFLWLRRQLRTPAEQRLGERIGRLYKLDCRSKDHDYRRFDQHPSAYLDPAHAPKLNRTSDRIIYRGPPRDHARLAADQQAYNERWESCWSIGDISGRMRRKCSLNVPREMIELRNNMVANLERDFGHAHDEKKVA
jgi:hypothetical protein